ncbi:MAG: phosphopantothenoylcysteine decarboxylase/phosphopantothenate--cysteine ligase [Planctomycetota bacterium]|jgi:phosphopantothenoylcysteine decarboxylase/phosphopantothenate--cysteine ligase
MTHDTQVPHIIITAGPTREYIDPVRYLSNESSGTMGFAIARAAVARGFRVTLIAGPVHQPTPEGVTRVDVVSALDMLAAMQEHFPSADAIFMAAAVGDFRPRERFEGKWKKKEEGGEGTVLALIENPDLLATIAADKGDRKVIAFALETSDGEARAAKKLVRKNADYIVLNSAAALNAASSTVTLIDANGMVWKREDRPKDETAVALMELF